MDRERCILILEGASGNYGMPFQARRGVTQGGPVSAKLFNILVDVVAREWMGILWDESELEEEAIVQLWLSSSQSFTKMTGIWPQKTRNSSNGR